MALSTPQKEYSIKMAKAMADKGTPIRDAATTWGVAKSTVHRRLSGALPLREAKEVTQILSPVQEDLLVQWILHEEAARRAPKKQEVRGFAQNILIYNGSSHTVGKNWVDRFLCRHESIRTKVAVKLEASRARTTTKEDMLAFYERLVC